MYTDENYGRDVLLGTIYRNLIYALLLVGVCEYSWSQGSYGRRLGSQRGGDVSFEPRGPGVMFGALDPAVKKWYIPQELFNDYGWRQWEYTNYARDEFRRYVNIHREGDSFYDFYGNLIGRGWLIYDCSQNQPEQLCSSIFQNSRFDYWFNIARPAFKSSSKD